MSVPPIVIICGVRQIGKTTFTKRLVARSSRVMVYDSALQFQGIGDGFISVWHNPDELKNNLLIPSFRVAYVPKHKEKDIAYFCKLAEWAAVKYGDVQVVFDDCGAYCSSDYIPAGIEDLIRYSGHKHISLILSTHRPCDFNNYTFGQASNIFCFFNESADDIKKVRANTGDGDALEQLKTLPPYTALHYSRNTWPRKWVFEDFRRI